MSEVQLHIVVDRRGRRAGFGPAQAAWLKNRGEIEGEPPEYTVRGDATVDELHALVMRQPELSECDFCRAIPAGWEVPIRPFDVKKGPQRGHFGRPVVVCEECAALVRADDEAGLVDRGVTAAIDAARAHGGALALRVNRLPRRVMYDTIAPLILEVASAVVHTRTEEPRPR